MDNFLTTDFRRILDIFSVTDLAGLMESIPAADMNALRDIFTAVDFAEIHEIFPLTYLTGLQDFPIGLFVLTIPPWYRNP